MSEKEFYQNIGVGEFLWGERVKGRGIERERVREKGRRIERKIVKGGIERKIVKGRGIERESERERDRERERVKGKAYATPPLSH